MAAADLTVFSDPEFDPKAWVNSACDSCPSGEPLERYLSELEMKLQLLAEDVSIALEEQSESALRRLPRAGAEVARADAEAKALAGAVARVLARLDAAAAASAAAVSTLASLDGAARRIEHVRGTLAEASGLADLLDRSPELLASGDVRAIADALAAMRRALAVVGGVPEFAEGAARVAALTDALEQLVRPALGSALAARDGASARELVAVLGAAGREGALERVYVAARLQPLLTAWEDSPSAAGSPADALAAALPPFHDAVLTTVDAEARWCADALPAHHPALLLALLTELHARTAKSYATRLAAAVVPPAASSSAAAASPPDAKAASLAALLPLHASAAAFTRSLARLLLPARPPPAALRALLEAATRPYEPYRVAYGDLERRSLTADLARLDLRDGGGLPAALRRMAASVPLAAEAVEAAAARCAALTGGAEADALLRAADDALCSYLTSLHALLRRQRAALGLAAAAADASADDVANAAANAAAAAAAPSGFGDETVHAALELLPWGAALLSRLSLLEAHLRAALADAAARLAAALPAVDGAEAASAEAAAAEAARDAALVATADPAALRVAALPERARRLAALFAAAAAPRFAPLPHAAPRAAALADAASDFVYDVLMARVTAALRGVAALPCWAATSAAGDGASAATSSATQSADPSTPTFALPLFSASPAEHVTAVGEYLLTLPQLLEAVDAAPTPRGGRPGGGGAFSTANDDDVLSDVDNVGGDADGGAAHAGAGGFASAWVGKVALGAAGAYTAAVLGIGSLTAAGSRQMEADADYFCNVLAALALPPPPPLATLRALAAAPAAGVSRAAAAAAAARASGGGDFEWDAAAAAAVSRMRAAGDALDAGQAPQPGLPPP